MERHRTAMLTLRAQHWVLLEQDRGVACLWQYGACLSSAKGHQADTDPRIPLPHSPPPTKRARQPSYPLPAQGLTTPFLSWQLVSVTVYHARLLQNPVAPHFARKTGGMKGSVTIQGDFD